MTAIFAGVGTALAVVFLIPQMTRVVVRRDIAGLSPAWAAFGMSTNMAWVTYLVSQALWAALVAPVLAALAYSITLRLIATRTTHRQWVRAAGPYALILVAVVSIWGWVGLGIALALTPIIQLAPGVMAAYRTRVPSGISPLTWSLAVLEAMAWGGYGLLTGDLPLIGYGVITAIGSALILSRCLATRPRMRLSPSFAEA
jgi:hypothetical protein